jgi:hypothetical protein
MEFIKGYGMDFIKPIKDDNNIGKYLTFLESIEKSKMTQKQNNICKCRWEFTSKSDENKHPKIMHYYND